MSARARTHGALAAEIVSDPAYQRQIERLCRHPRLVAELVAEIAAEQNIRAEVEGKVARYCQLDREALRITGGDRFPAPLIYKVAA